MKEFDYIILGGGCAGLSLAYELDINKKLNDKTLAIVETRDEYKRDKTWSFWKVTDHNFNDCVIKSWNKFSINSELGSHEVVNKEYPYQTIDSGLFYKKVLNQLTLQKRDLNKLNITGRIQINREIKALEKQIAIESELNAERKKKLDVSSDETKVVNKANDIAEKTISKITRQKEREVDLLQANTKNKYFIIYNLYIFNHLFILIKNNNNVNK